MDVERVVEQLQDTSLVGALVALLSALAWIIRRERRNGNGTGHGDQANQAKIAAEVERQVMIHDLQNEVEGLREAVERQERAIEKLMSTRDEFEEEAGKRLTAIEANLEYRGPRRLNS
jgi:predicted RNase H-like nuclease (RuvC/YqgF family)